MSQEWENTKSFKKEVKSKEKKQSRNEGEKPGLKQIVGDLRNKENIKKEEKKMTSEKKTTEKKKKKKSRTNELTSDVISDLQEMQNVVRDAVDDAAENVEKVHQKIISLPPKYLGKIERFEDLSSDIQEVQEKTLGHVYDLIKTINNKFNDIAVDVLKRSEKRLEQDK
jgi:hypothetical protein